MADVVSLQVRKERQTIENKKTIGTKQGLSDDVGGHRRNPIGSSFQPPQTKWTTKKFLLKQKREKRFKRDAGLNDALLVYNENVSIDSHRSFTRLFCISYGWNTPLD
jgi:hypothetical protein